MSESPEPQRAPYEVLARKYRPQNFRDLIGQDAMVRTLRNAFATGRIAHAFILTGVRGVGKTTTARIIAKGLNCEAGEGPTIEPCGACEACVSIAAGRNTDVLEMDAASNTGVDDVREIIESVRYRASRSRYKVYVVDEVHMLSTNAFNALLKTLEEPPEHVKFVFATTEIRKVPVTVLSRCQRFDLRRIEPEAMMAHLAKIAAAEGAEVEEGALALVTRAAEGSVRDALSLLDQALAQGQGPATAETVRAMLGLADRARVIELFEAVMRGEAKAALAELAAQYAEGAEPGAVLRDLAELTHWISVLKVSPELAEDPTVPPEERRRGTELAERLSMRALGRAWQVLLKGLEETAVAPNAMMAAEMVLIRLTHLADLPPPEELVKRILAAESGAPAPAPAGSGGGGGSSARAEPPPRPVPSEAPPGEGPAPRLQALAGGRAEAVPARAAPAAEMRPELAGYARFEDVCEALSAARELRLLDAVEHHLELVAYAPGRIEFHPAAGAPADLAGRLSEALREITGARWSVAVTEAPGAPTIAAARAAAAEAAKGRAAAHPLVARALEVFPGAEIRDIRPLTPEAAPAAPADGDYLAAPPEDGEEDDGADAALVEWDDPFEEG